MHLQWCWVANSWLAPAKSLRSPQTAVPWPAWRRRCAGRTWPGPSTGLSAGRSPRTSTGRLLTVNKMIIFNFSTEQFSGIWNKALLQMKLYLTLNQSVPSTNETKIKIWLFWRFNSLVKILWCKTTFRIQLINLHAILQIKLLFKLEILSFYPMVSGSNKSLFISS